MHMNNSHRILSEMYEQAVQQPIPEDNRKNALGKLALYAKRKTKVQEYEAAVANVHAAFERISDISGDEELVAYAEELWNNRNKLNPQDRAVYETLMNWARTNRNNGLGTEAYDCDASPFNHINDEDGPDEDEDEDEQPE